MERGPEVLTQQRGTRSRSLAPDSATAWRWIGWFGLVIGAVGLGDFLLVWVPFRFGVVEWEFATVTASFSGLPLITMGVAGVLGAALARGTRWLVRLVGWWMVVWGVLLLAAYVVFLLDVPLALRAVREQPVAQLGIGKAIAKTSLLAVAFTLSYFVGALAAFRHLGRNREIG